MTKTLPEILKEEREKYVYFSPEIGEYLDMSHHDYDAHDQRIINAVIEMVEGMPKPNFLNEAFSLGYDRGRNDIITKLQATLSPKE